MSVIGGVIIACLASALAMTTIVDAASARAVVAGMAGPLVSACGTWIMIDRARLTSPAAMTQRLLSAFLVKVVLFLCYVFVAVKVLALPGKPFALSFTGYFIVLHHVEAVLWRQCSVRASSLS